MTDLLFEFLEREKEIHIRNKLEGNLSIRLSSVFLCVVSFFYIFSPVDILPEALFNSWLFLIDDLILFILSILYTLDSIHLKGLAEHVNRFKENRCQSDQKSE